MIQTHNLKFKEMKLSPDHRVGKGQSSSFTPDLSYLEPFRPSPPQTLRSVCEHRALNPQGEWPERCYSPLSGALRRAPQVRPSVPADLSPLRTPHSLVPACCWAV